MLISTVNEMFIRYLRHRYVGYSTTTTRTIMDQLYATYADISSADLQDNDAKLRAPYDANLPIKTLIYQVKGAVEYAADRNTPYTLLQVVGISYQFIFQTRLFNDNCKLWKRRDPSDKTWTQFKTFFFNAHQQLRKLQATTAGAGYHASNHVDQHAANHVYQQETVDAISNLATTTASDPVLVATLTATNRTLAAALTLSNSKLVTALQDVARLTGTISELFWKIGNPNPATAPEVGWSKRHYYWTCGYTYKHSSRDFPSPATGHIKGVTKSKRLGGSTKNQPSLQTQVTKTYKEIVINNLTFNSLVTAPQTRAIADSGCTSHFLGANTPCTNKIATSNGILVGLPNGANIQVTRTLLLPFPQISLAAHRANIFPDLQNRALISIRKLYDNGFAATFSKDHLKLVKQNVTITGNQNAIIILYYIDLAPRPKPTVQNDLSLPTSHAHIAYKMMTKLYLVRYLHRAAFIPFI